MDLKVTSATVGSIVALVTTVYGGLEWLDSNYASAGDVKAIELRLEQKILSDQLRDVEHRIWTIEERYGATLGNASNKDTREELKRLKSERDEINAQLEGIRERAMKHRFKE